MPKITAEKILLGAGVVFVDSVAIGLTRGGSIFTVERDIRTIGADGDYGPVKGRQVIDKEVAKLKVNALELFNATEMTAYYPALSVTPDVVETPTLYTMTGTLQIIADDHHDIEWVGKTADGKAITITVENAINLANLEWGLADKSEVVPEIDFTGTYLEAARETPPWNVVYAA